MYTIKDMPRNDRPRERLMKLGAKSLSTYELIAIIFRFGYLDQSAIDLAKTLIGSLRSLSELREKTIPEIAKIKGIGETKAISLLAAIELGERVLHETKAQIQIASPSDVFGLLKYDMKNLEQEVLIALYLDVKTNLIAKKQIFIGGLNQSLVHPREVFKYAVKYSAYSIILVHNHPSGDPEPSPQDLEVTKRFKEAGKMLQIDLLDHIIIANDTYLSIKEYNRNRK
ncbi:MAG: DNA repair protein RadC [Bacilli bacterium]|nr:DNA repair protein RadC [Bacilli bacterium]MBN2876127.1 DNA repair protein RadC [Bacilli bacterium]